MDPIRTAAYEIYVFGRSTFSIVLTWQVATTYALWQGRSFCLGARYWRYLESKRCVLLRSSGLRLSAVILR